MDKWQDIFNKFFNEWHYRDNTIGALVCGSFITGNPSPNSDLDVHLILKDTTQFRERGNMYLDGILVEYFANPPQQIEKYMEEDFNSYSRMSMVQFLTGQIIFDPLGVVLNLKKLGQKWFDKPFLPVSQETIEYQKYGFWDMLDNLDDLRQKNSQNFDLTFYNYLHKVIDFYRKVLGYDEIRSVRMYEIFTSPTIRQKYLLPEFPDKDFAKIVILSLESKTIADKFNCFYNLINYCQSKLGDFKIDGWKYQCKLDF